jgi:hypothetical protein
MGRQNNAYGFVVVVLILWALAGCASSGTVKQLTAADAVLLAGVWQGTVTPPGGSATQPGTLTIRPDGTYSTEAGAYSSTGKFQIKDGTVHFFSTSGSGGMGAGERSGTASLMDRTTTWGLEGSGRGSVAGPYNFNFSKAK